MLGDFWGNFFLLLIFLPLAMLLIFALVDIFRRHDMSGGAKAVWVAVVIVIPFIGALVYIAMRPTVTSDAGRARYARAAHEFEQPPSG
ncbi:MAG: PLDc N-terminal domain-containing protein [Gaiellaceae bacterium]